jgi:hypothetical protein
MLQQVKALFHNNRKRLQAGTLSFVLGFILLLGLLSLLSWPIGVAQAESKRPLEEKATTAELIGVCVT